MTQKTEPRLIMVSPTEWEPGAQDAGGNPIGSTSPTRLWGIPLPEHSPEGPLRVDPTRLGRRQAAARKR